MKKIGIAIYKSRLPIFEKALNDVGFNFTQGEGLTKDSITLYLTVKESEITKVAETCKVASSKAVKSTSKN